LGKLADTRDFNQVVMNNDNHCEDRFIHKFYQIRVRSIRNDCDEKNMSRGQRSLFCRTTVVI